MKFQVLLLIVLLIIMDYCSINFAIPSDIKLFIDVNGVRLYLNEQIADQTGFIVYGNHRNVPGNDYRDDSGKIVNGNTQGAIPRYLGYDIQGNMYTNADFPSDFDEIANPWNGANWVKRPWLYELCTKSYYNKSPNYFNRMVYKGEYWVGKPNNSGGTWTTNSLSDYFNIQSPPIGYAIGSARGWNLYEEKYYYQTFVLEPELRLPTVTPSPTPSPKTSIVSTVTPRTTSTLIITASPTSNITATPTIKPIGSIKFYPESFYWKNTDQDISINIDGNMISAISSTYERSYAYTNTVQVPVAGGGTRTEVRTMTASIRWPYTQLWQVGNVYVWGAPFVDSKNEVPSYGGNVTISTDGIGQLFSELKEWLPGSKSWDPGSPPQGTWINSTPPDTLPPVEKYTSFSGAYMMDKTSPAIDFDWSSQYSNVGDVHEFIFDPNNFINIGLSDNLSGIKDSKYMWSRSPQFPELVNMMPLNATTSEGMLDYSNQTIYPHQNQNYKVNEWYVHAYAIDRANNEARVTAKINFTSLLSDLEITDIRDPNWEKVFRDSSNNLIASYPVSRMPVDKHPDYGDTGVCKKGYNMYFELQSEGLNLNSDYIYIVPEFYWANDLNSFNKTPVDLYYISDSNSFIKVGSESDGSHIFLNNIPIGESGYINLGSSQRTIISETKSVWKGKYCIPHSSIPILHGKSVANESNWMKDGYILVQFDVKAYKYDENGNPAVVFDYMNNDRYGREDRYTIEGGPKGINYMVGDVITFNNRYSALDDYGSSVDR